MNINQMQLPEQVKVHAVMDDDTEITMIVERSDLLEYVEGLREFLVGKGYKTSTFKAISRTHTVYMTWDAEGSNSEDRDA